MSRTPPELTDPEWEEIRQHETVIDCWGLAPDVTRDDFRKSVFAVKFAFEPQTMPNYRGDVFVVLGDSLEPLVLVRHPDGNLVTLPSRREVLKSLGRIFITVLGGVAEIEAGSVPEGVDVEMIDLDYLKDDAKAFRQLSPAAQAWVKRNGYL